MPASHSTCPHCNQRTKKIVTEQKQGHWFDKGTSFLSQTVERAQVCEHCGTAFNRSEDHTPAAKRSIGVLLMLICGSAFAAVAVMLTGRAVGWW